MLKIGLTGGIGAGKTTVAKIFIALGIPVYDADSQAKRLMNENPDLKKSITEEFGIEAYTDGQLNRAFIAGIVFNDPEKLAKLNALVHPVTIIDAEEWFKNQEAPYVIKEAALMFESAAHLNLDIVVGVFAPKALRIQRVMKRDSVSKDDVIKRMEKQIDDEIKKRLCDYVIVNDDQQMIIPQVLELDKLFGTSNYA